MQWIAPLASEAPELLVAGLYAWRLNTNAGLGTLVSSKVNQWTLLVGTLPIVFAISSGSLHGLPLDAIQREELFLTAAQSFFAIAILVNLRMSLREAGFLFGLFWAQFVLGALVPEQLHGIERVAVGIVYMIAGVLAVHRGTRGGAQAPARRLPNVRTRSWACSPRRRARTSSRPVPADRPMDPDAVLDRLDAANPGGLAHTHELAAREPATVPFPDGLPGVLADRLGLHGIEGLYPHQRSALDALREGRDVVMATGTASGKSLVYQARVRRDRDVDAEGHRAAAVPHEGPGARPAPRGARRSASRRSRRPSTTATRPPRSDR